MRGGRRPFVIFPEIHPVWYNVNRPLDPIRYVIKLKFFQNGWRRGGGDFSYIYLISIFGMPKSS